MKKLLFPALAAAVSLSACAPKNSKGNSDPVKATVEQTKQQVEQTKKDVDQTKNDLKTEIKKETPAPAPAVTVEAKKTEAKVEAKAEEKTAPKAEAKVEAKTQAPIVRADGKPEIFGKDFICTEDFPARFAPFQSAFADAAKATDEAIKAMQPVVDRLDDSSQYHVKVKANYLELTKAYKAMLKEFGMTFGCFYMLPKGAQVNITSDTFKAQYEQLRARVGKLLGEPHLGPEINDI